MPLIVPLRHDKLGRIVLNSKQAFGEGRDNGGSNVIDYNDRGTGNRSIAIRNIKRSLSLLVHHV